MARITFAVMRYARLTLLAGPDANGPDSSAVIRRAELCCGANAALW